MNLEYLAKQLLSVGGRGLLWLFDFDNDKIKCIDKDKKKTGVY